MNIKHNAIKKSNKTIRVPFYQKTITLLKENEIELDNIATNVYNNRLDSVVELGVHFEDRSNSTYHETQQLFTNYKPIFTKVIKASDANGAAALLPNQEKILLKLPERLNVQGATVRIMRL